MLNINVEEYGAIADGKTLSSAAVQKAVDFCAENGGGEVVFEKGDYVLGTVFLKSNVNVHICEGAAIYGAESFYDYAPEEKVDYPLYQDSSHSFFHCSMFVGIDCENVTITGKGKIDMRSVWDEDDVRKILHRGPKCIALKNCKKVKICGIGIYNATDLAVYFAGCENVEISELKLQVYIDGISPDNSKNVIIKNCDIESGDDGIVFKSSYTLNRFGECRDIEVLNCKIKSRCNAVKFGTESNFGFKNIYIHDCEIYDTRIAGIAVESVDGAIADNLFFKNIKMTNVNVPIFIHLGSRLRGPEGTAVGAISNIYFEDIYAAGPYEKYECMPWSYRTYKANDREQTPQIFGRADTFDGYNYSEDWQITSNVCGLIGYPLKNISFKNIELILDGGLKQYEKEVPDGAQAYPEAYVYGRFLPAKGIYFRHIDGLELDNVKISSYRDDVREDFVFEDVKNLIKK